eukprot:2143976-Karenia_brevis.AAC.1
MKQVIIQQQHDIDTLDANTGAQCSALEHSNTGHASPVLFDVFDFDDLDESCAQKSASPVLFDA